MLPNEELKAFIPTTDAEKAKFFYKDLLGLKLMSEDDYALEFDANGTSLRVTGVQQFKRQRLIFRLERRRGFMSRMGMSFLLPNCKSPVFARLL